MKPHGRNNVFCLCTSLCSPTLRPVVSLLLKVQLCSFSFSLASNFAVRWERVHKVFSCQYFESTPWRWDNSLNPKGLDCPFCITNVQENKNGIVGENLLSPINQNYVLTRFVLTGMEKYGSKYVFVWNQSFCTHKLKLHVNWLHTKQKGLYYST